MFYFTPLVLLLLLAMSFLLSTLFSLARVYVVLTSRNTKENLLCWSFLGSIHCVEGGKWFRLRSNL